MRKAQVDYWLSVHNNSPGKYPVYHNSGNSNLLAASQELARFIEQYKASDWGDQTSFFLGSKHLISTEAPIGILVSLDPQLKSLFPQSVEKDTFFGFAHHSENGWRIKSSDIEFEISSDVMIR